MDHIKCIIVGTIWYADYVNNETCSKLLIDTSCIDKWEENNKQNVQYE